MLKRIKDFLLVKETIVRYGSLGDLTGGQKIHYKEIVPTRFGRVFNRCKYAIEGFIYDIRHPGERDNF